MITHTPRCDLEFHSDKGDDSPALAFARQLETELSEARAERDAARARFNELIELAYVPAPHDPSVRCWAKTYKELHEAAEKAAEFWRNEYKGLPPEKLISLAIMRAVCRESDFRALEKAQADLTRLRAVADELADFVAKVTAPMVALPRNGMRQIGEQALARYHAATAKAAANTGVNHRTE